MFFATLNEFKAYNLANKKTYSVNSGEALAVAEAFFVSVYEKYLPLFDVFTDYELSDIRGTVRNKIKKFFMDLSEKGIKGNTFTVVGMPENPVYRGNGYDLILEYDTKMYDM